MPRSTQLSSQLVPQPEDTGESSDDEYLMGTPCRPAPHALASPKEVILHIPVMHPKDQSDSEGYTDGSDTHFSEQSDPQADTRGSPPPNSGDQDSPHVDHPVTNQIQRTTQEQLRDPEGRDDL